MIHLILAIAAAGPPAGDGAAARLRAFAVAHCVDCHGAAVQRGKFRLDALPLDGNEAAWARVHDRVRRGDMPPKGKPRPPAEETSGFLAGLRDRLHHESLFRQRAEGRVVLRRLNRTEYQTTLRDLLGTPVEVADLLPDENAAAGFDNVSAALDISPVHLLRYQEAAEKALRATIPTRPRTTIKDRRTGKRVTELQKQFAPYMGKSAVLDGDTLLLYTRTYGHVPVATATAPVAGRYRIRASVKAVGTDGAPLPVLLSRREEYGSDTPDAREVQDVVEGKWQVIGGEYYLKPRQLVVFNGWTLPIDRDFKKGTDKRALAVEWVEIEGPLDDWPPPSYRAVFGDVPLEPLSVAKLKAAGRPVPPPPAKRSDYWWLYDTLTVAPDKPRADAERLLRAFLPKAFRRPVPEAERKRFVEIAHKAMDAGEPFGEAMLLAYRTALCSPHFLFLVEPPGKLDDHALASRLSYFLWSSMPDEALSALAAKGELARPAVLRAQVERMLADPKAARFTANFAGQWLDLRQINATSPDPAIYGEFDDFLFWTMPRETKHFFEEVLRRDQPLTDFVHSDWTFLNERLAKHYGIAGVRGGELRRTALPEGSRRGGVMTQAAILKVTADGTRTSPIIRGKWVLERIVGRPPAPPPPDTPAIEPDIRGATTIRQQLDRHRDTAACAACHRHIDPPGFALENFDVIGGWRDFYRATGRTPAGFVRLPNYPNRSVMRGPDVEKGGVSADGKPFKDIDGYKAILLADKDQLARSLAEKLLVYGTGADIQFSDREEVERLVAACREKKYGFRSLLHEVVQCRVFKTK